MKKVYSIYLLFYFILFIYLFEKNDDMIIITVKSGCILPRFLCRWTKTRTRRRVIQCYRAACHGRRAFVLFLVGVELSLSSVAMAIPIPCLIMRFASSQCCKRGIEHLTVWVGEVSRDSDCVFLVEITLFYTFLYF